MNYTFKVKKVEGVAEDASFTRRVKLSVKGDVRFDYNLDENEYVYSVPVAEGTEIRVDYAHKGCSPHTVTFTSGSKGVEEEHYSVLRDGVEVEVITPEDVGSTEDLGLFPDTLDLPETDD